MRKAAIAEGEGLAETEWGRLLLIQISNSRGNNTSWGGLMGPRSWKAVARLPLGKSRGCGLRPSAED